MKQRAFKISMRILKGVKGIKVSVKIVWTNMKTAQNTTPDSIPEDSTKGCAEPTKLSP